MKGGKKCLIQREYYNKIIMGLDVPKTNLVVVNSCPPSAWEFSQQVLFGTWSFFINFW